MRFPPLRFITLVLVASGAFGLISAQAPPPTPPLVTFDVPLWSQSRDAFEPLRTLGRQGLDKTGTPGLSVAIAKNDKVAWNEGFGKADVENDLAVRPDSVFRIASISKTMTATAIMQLVERGKVSLDDPIRRYVPAFPDKTEGTVTLRHLLTHTSGVRHYNDGEFDNKASYDTLDAAFTVFARDPLRFAPGAKYLYSTYGYNLLAGVVEAVSGVTFEQYLTEHVWKPAGMGDTRLEHPQEIVRHRVRQYVRTSSNKELLNAPYADLSVKWAGGGIISTAPDLARFHLALERGALLKADTLAQMYVAATLNDGTKTEYGLGWQVVMADGRRWIAHSGGATGGTTYLLRSPETDLAVVLLSNVQNARGLRELALAFAKVVE
jgi:serine beta-lactamase-like protein LACTB